VSLLEIIPEIALVDLKHIARVSLPKEAFSKPVKSNKHKHTNIEINNLFFFF